VDRFHSEALAAGGRDDGAPGLRPYHDSYYAAFVIDPDGDRIEAVCHEPVGGVTSVGRRDTNGFRIGQANVRSGSTTDIKPMAGARRVEQ